MDDEQPFKASQRYSHERAVEAYHYLAPGRREYLMKSLSDRSLIQYASAWRQWSAHADTAGHSAMPATAEQLEAWVWVLIEDKKLAPDTIKSYVSVVAKVHRLDKRSDNRTMGRKHIVPYARARCQILPGPSRAGAGRLTAEGS